MGSNSHITYTYGPCTFTYPDDARCLYDGRLLDSMCAEHRMIHQKREQAKRHRTRARDKETVA